MPLVERSLRHQLTAALALALAVALLQGGTALAQTTADAPSAVALDDSCNDVPEDGFTDVPESHTFHDEIECLKAYGFTEGAGDGSVYEPGKFVPRWQMVTFIARVAREFDDHMATFDLPAPSDQGFDDIDDLEQRFQDNINQMAQIGVVFGRNADTFDPYGNVKRDQMASFINRLQGAVQDSEGGDPDGFESSEDFFPDDEDEVEHEDNINGIASVGIVQGKTDGDYDPNEPVTRGQMAAFIMRYYEVNVDQGRVESQYPSDGSTPAEAPAGDIALDDDDGDASDARVNVDSADKPNDSFVGCDIQTDGATGAETTDQDDCATYNYDSGDTFSVDGTTTDLAGFEAALSVNDDVTGTYDPTGSSTFNLFNESETPDDAATGAIAATNVASADKADDSFVGCAILTDGVTGVEVVDDADCATYNYDSGDTFSVDGTATDLAGFEAALSANDDVTGTYDPTGSSIFNLFNESETATGGPTATVATFVDGLVGVVVATDVFGDEIGDELVITYDENVDVDAGDTVTLDAAGDDTTTTTYTCGTDVTCITTPGTDVTLVDDVLTVTVLNAGTAPDTAITDGTSEVDDTTGVTDGAGNEADGYPVTINDVGGGVTP
ncbi:hypothetical protein BH23ACT10_BH23ACT10_26600 [soil metagenome]